MPPTRQLEEGHVRIAAKLRIGKRHHELWYRLPASYESFLSDLSDPFLLASLFPAMQQARDIHVHGRVSTSLIDHLGQYLDVWHKWEPGGFSKIDIRAEELVASPQPKNPFTAMMFSGGLDSCHTLWKHTLDPDTKSQRKPKFALFVHGFDIPLEKEDAYEDYYPKAKEITDSVDVGLIRVQTNFRKIIGNWVNSHGLALASCLHLFGGRCTAGLIASSHTYDSLRLPWGSNPVTDPLMSSDQLRIINDGGECGRWQKAATIAKWPLAIKHLRVCYEREGLDHNCGVCDNCCFTALSFAASGSEIPSAMNTGSAREVVAQFRTMPLGDIALLRIQELIAYAKDMGVRDAWLSELRDCHDFHARRLKLPKPVGKLALWWDRRLAQRTT